MGGIEGLTAQWSADPAVLGTIAIGLFLWLRGRAVLRRGSPQSGWSDRWWYVPSFLGALATMIVAACSPIDDLADTLFWVHMVQHLLLLMLVAPLLAAAAPWLPLWYGLPRALRRLAMSAHPLRDAFAGPAGAWWAPVFLVAFIAGTWLWHLPALYDAALGNEIVHDYGEHNTFLLVGLLFWLQIIPSAPFSPPLGTIGRGALLAVAVVQNVVLSIVLAVAPHPLYRPYAQLGHRPGGLTALMDQQIGAAIMWSVGDLPFIIAMIALVMNWLRSEMDEAQRDDGPANAVPATPSA
jgi:cytochrome c oxidase assembly factor CtaG